jgi:hypothetical protein
MSDPKYKIGGTYWIKADKSFYPIKIIDATWRGKIHQFLYDIISAKEKDAKYHYFETEDALDTMLVVAGDKTY